ncbi:transglutaminase family protein [Emticicia sp. C21]|uniref:transglutaminase domain-containing protein n=1 Tax=Emticicia sp. C21 TaxID=2302915 RepID=UPI000E349B2B|nr:transglutaminase family protein [Emticicia sp. C21]RFS13376.1 transglutaminase family protein [Emticicia sp. C21]
MKLAISCQLDYKIEESTPLILMLRPRSGAGQWVTKEEYLLEPNVPVTEYTDLYGNLCQRVFTPQGNFSIKTSAIVEVADQIDVDFSANFVPVQELPDDVLIYLLPSRYCESDKLGNLASSIVAHVETGYEQVEAIRKWINANIIYEYGNSNASTSAQDTAQSKIGVCRDFSHLGVALCRSMTIPARFVVGYLHQLKPMDLHAWFEAYLGGRWYTFDATQTEPKGNRVVLAYGRDAADVALATQFGPMELQNMTVSVEPAREQ